MTRETDLGTPALDRVSALLLVPVLRHLEQSTRTPRTTAITRFDGVAVNRTIRALAITAQGDPAPSHRLSRPS